MINILWYGSFRITSRINPRPISSFELKLSGWYWCLGLIQDVIRKEPYNILYLSYILWWYAIWCNLYGWYRQLWVSVLKPGVIWYFEPHCTGADMRSDNDFHCKTRITTLLLYTNKYFSNKFWKFWNLMKFFESFEILWKFGIFLKFEIFLKFLKFYESFKILWIFLN
jgi:hypothetical protein